jgi:hypothetical protein
LVAAAAFSNTLLILGLKYYYDVHYKEQKKSFNNQSDRDSCSLQQ